MNLLTLLILASAEENPLDSDHWVIYSNIGLVIVTLITIILTVREGHRHTEVMSEDSDAAEERMAKIALAAIHAEEAEHANQKDAH